MSENWGSGGTLPPHTLELCWEPELGGVEVGFARTALAPRNMRFEKRKNDRMKVGSPDPRWPQSHLWWSPAVLCSAMVIVTHGNDSWTNAGGGVSTSYREVKSEGQGELLDTVVLVTCDSDTEGEALGGWGPDRKRAQTGLSLSFGRGLQNHLKGQMTPGNRKGF